MRRTVGLLLVLVLVPSWAPARTNVFRSAFLGQLTSGGVPTGVGLGDFDGDGALEVVSTATGTLDREISFCGWFPIDDPPPGFGSCSDQAGPTFPSALIVQDFDGDGQVDLVTTSASDDSVAFLKGRGDEDQIDPPISVAVGGTPRDVASGLINDDEHLDLAVANDGPSLALPGSVSILLGAGDGSFELCDMLEAEEGTAAVAVGHLDADGLLDVVAVNTRAYTLAIWLGEGNCTFGPRDSIGTGAAPMDVALGDLNEDGILDAVTADNNEDAVSVFLGRGDGTFQLPADHAVGTAPNRVLIEDLDGDGHRDILASNVQSGDVSVLYGDGRGGVAQTRHFVTDSQPRALAIGDLDGDGVLDIIAGVEPEVSHVAALLGIAGGGFHAVEDLPAGVQPETVAVADVDNDSYADLVATSATGEVFVYRSHPAGGFRSARRVALGGRPFGVVAADLNRDLLPDIAVTDREGGMVAVALGVGGGAFGPVRRFATAADPTGIVSGDFNGDGRVDLAVTAGGAPGTVSALLQAANGSFGPARNTTVENTPVGFGAADFNGDGRTDLVVANQASETVQVLRSLGDGTFASSQTLPPSAVGRATAIAIADFNADGRADFAVSDFSPGSENVRLFLGNGNATFQAGQALRAGDQVRALGARDFTGDGRVDLAVVNQTSNGVQVLVQNADGTLQSVSRSGMDVVSRMPVSIAAGDFDGDGRYDAATSNNDPNSNNLSVLTNCVRDPECYIRIPLPGEAAVRGDANSDGVASAADLVVVAREVADGDGTRAEDIRLGGVVAAPGADANGDGRVDAQDRLGVLRRIFIGT